MAHPSPSISIPTKADDGVDRAPDLSPTSPVDRKRMDSLLANRATPGDLQNKGILKGMLFANERSVYCCYDGEEQGIQCAAERRESCCIHSLRPHPTTASYHPLFPRCLSSVLHCLTPRSPFPTH